MILKTRTLILFRPLSLSIPIILTWVSEVRLFGCPWSNCLFLTHARGYLCGSSRRTLPPLFSIISRGCFFQEHIFVLPRQVFHLGNRECQVSRQTAVCHASSTNKFIRVCFPFSRNHPTRLFFRTQFPINLVLVGEYCSNGLMDGSNGGERRFCKPV